MDDTAEVGVAAGNRDQLTAWDGTEGAYWATHADQYDAGVSAYHRALLDLAGLQPTDTVLDVGCGTGQTSRDAARSITEGFVLGVDLSSAMLDVARDRAARDGLTNVRFEQADAQVHPFEPTFDVVLSRTGTMFFADQAAAWANLASALRPGGRLAISVWQPMTENAWFTEFVGALAAGRDLPAPPPDAPSPFALSDPARVEPLLMQAGFVDVQFDDVRAPMTFGTTPAEADGFIAGQLGWLVADLDEATRRSALDALLRVMEENQTPDGVQLGSAMWLISARRADV